MTRRPWLARLAALFLSVAVLAGCATTPAPTDLAATLAAQPELSTLSRLVQQAQLADTLRGAGPYTVFAPSDAAFKALKPQDLEALSKDPAQLKAVLGFHLVPARLPSTEVKQGSVKSVQGASLALSRAGTFVTVEDAVVTQPDIVATNGVVHVIDRVLMPPKR